MMIDKHTLALISIVGGALDMLGALYLAYDLLGGEHGPLRTLTRGVTYGVLFGAGYGLALGPVFGLASGVAHGITLAWEYSRASRHQPKPGFWYDTAMSAIRGGGFALGAAYLYGGTFGAVFGALHGAFSATANGPVTGPQRDGFRTSRTGPSSRRRGRGRPPGGSGWPGGRTA